MAQVLQGNQGLMQVMGDLYFEMLDVPGSEKIAERLKKTLPPGLAEAGEGEDAPPMVQTPEGPVPVEAAGQMIAQLSQQMQGMAEALEKADVVGKQAKIEDAQTKRMSAEADAGLRAQELELEFFRAQTERMKAESAAALDDAKVKQIVFEAVRDYVDRTPQEDSGLLSPLHKPERPSGESEPSEPSERN
jgi:hypothetical protein